MAKAIEDQVITREARFTFHDLRAFYATQHKQATGELPDLHKNPETTARVYDRNTIVKRSSICRIFPSWEYSPLPWGQKKAPVLALRALARVSGGVADGTRTAHVSSCLY